MPQVAFVPDALAMHCARGTVPGVPGSTKRKKMRHEDFVFAAACCVHLVRNSGPRYLNMPIKIVQGT